MGIVSSCNEMAGEVHSSSSASKRFIALSVAQYMSMKGVVLPESQIVTQKNMKYKHPPGDRKFKQKHSSSTQLKLYAISYRRPLLTANVCATKERA